MSETNLNPELEKSSKKRRSKSKAGYIVGSLALCAGACVAIPKLMPKVTAFIYDQMYKSPDSVLDEDRWYTGPKIPKEVLQADEEAQDNTGDDLDEEE